MDWTSLIIKILLVAGLAILVWYLTSGSNIAVVATIGAIALGVWFAFFRKGGISLKPGNGKNDTDRPGGRPAAAKLASV